MADKKHILFVPRTPLRGVDDEPKIQSGLRRMLHSMRGEWSMVFAAVHTSDKSQGQ
jgi:hypothetical protein